jgi:hypothetical protein
MGGLSSLWPLMWRILGVLVHSCRRRNDCPRSSYSDWSALKL